MRFTRTRSRSGRTLGPDDGRTALGRETAGAGLFGFGVFVTRAAARPEPAFLAFACGLACALAFTLGFGTYATCTWICFGLASSRFGRVSFSTPSLKSALIFSLFTTFGRVKDRVNDP